MTGGSALSELGKNDNSHHVIYSSSNELSISQPIPGQVLLLGTENDALFKHCV